MIRYRFFIVSLMAAMILFSIVTMKVYGQGEQAIAIEREFYEELEEAYMQRLQDTLSIKGYRNAGITMTKVYYEDGSREYTALIHHKRIDRLSEGERILLLSELEAIDFGDAGSLVLHKFLDYEE